MMFAIKGDVEEALANAKRSEDGSYPADWITKAGMERPFLAEDFESEWPSLLPYYWSGQVDDDSTRERLFQLLRDFKEKQNSKKEVGWFLLKQP